MLILRIRQAETALKNGRLDEAYELATDRDLRSHRHGQKLVDRLTAALLERGRGHLSEGRWAEALADCQKAGTLGGNLTEAAALRAAIDQARAVHNRQQREHEDALATARDNLERGRLDQARHALDQADADSIRADHLRVQLESVHGHIEHAVQLAQQAVNAGDFEAALDPLIRIGASPADSGPLGPLSQAVTNGVAALAQTALESGRLDRAEHLLRNIQRLSGPEHRAIQESAEAIQHGRSARTALDQGDYRSAIRALQRFQLLLPRADWVPPSLELLRTAAEQIDTLGAGPLGLLDSTSQRLLTQEATAILAPDHEQETVLRDHAAAEGPHERIPTRFMLLIDGVGSYMVMRDRVVTVGPMSSSHRPEVGLLAEAGLPAATFERSDEDYFVASERPIAVNGTATTRQLLADGDRIALSSRCQFRLHKPNAASSTAVLRLTGGRLARADARHVVLMDRSVMIGPAANAHIRATQLANPLLLYVRDHRLYARTSEPVRIDGQPATDATPLPMNTPVQVGNVSFTVTAIETTARA